MRACNKESSATRVKNSKKGQTRLCLLLLIYSIVERRLLRLQNRDVVTRMMTEEHHVDKA